MFRPCNDVIDNPRPAAAERVALDERIVQGLAPPLPTATERTNDRTKAVMSRKAMKAATIRVLLPRLRLLEVRNDLRLCCLLMAYPASIDCTRR